MQTLYLVHWHEQEARERAGRLRQAGYAVRFDRVGEKTSLKDLRADPPDAFVIDISRLPSHGREVAVALRQSKATRLVPIVFVDGAADKIDRVRAALPDATFTTWGKIRSALKSAMKKRVADLVVPRSISGPYSGTPLPKKLGIKPGSSVSLIGAPKNINAILGQLPDDVTLIPNARKPCNLILWFVQSPRDLLRRIDGIGKRVGAGSLWIIWPKKTSGVKTDLTQQMIREAGLARGLVDFKICAVDDTWSGLRFAVRKK